MRGPDIAGRFRAAVHELDVALSETRASLQQAETARARLEAEREHIFLRLSEVYLPELGRETVDGLRQTLPGMYARFDALLREKAAEQRQVSDTLDQHGRERGRLDAALDELTDRIERLAGDRDRLTDQVATALEKRPHHAELARSVRQTETRHEQAERRHAAALLERDDKVPAYEQDRLFSYLLHRRYGTTEYRALRLIRRLDDWVAARVDFLPQRRNYQLLCEVPVATEEALRESARERDDRRQRLRALEKEIEDLHGLTQVIDEGDKLYEQRQTLVTQIGDADAAQREATARDERLESGRGKYHEDARAELVEFLESQPIRRLEELARSTTTPGDDELTGALERWDSEWTRTTALVDTLRREHHTATEKLDGLRKIERRFRASDFEASNSTFAPGLDVVALVGNFIGGALTLQQLWRRVATSQRFEPTPFQRAGPILQTVLWEVARSAARGGLRGAGRRGRGGGFGGGRSRTTGGFGGFGGGSRTTGGFG